jgi:hypothetical protein
MDGKGLEGWGCVCKGERGRGGEVVRII